MRKIDSTTQARGARKIRRRAVLDSKNSHHSFPPEFLSSLLEGAAAQSTDTVMVLDELGVVDGRDAAQAFYGLANGQGKQRAARDGSPREPKFWRMLYLSSGELPVEAKLVEAS